MAFRLNAIVSGVEIDMSMKLKMELGALLNKHSRENESNTPDYILALYMMNCLRSFEDAVKKREEWYGRTPDIIEREVELPESR